jgi:RNA polymerase sigma-70 factor (ECF subfamily)
VQGTDTDEIIELVDRALTRDRQAQFALYNRYAKAMFNVAMRMMNDYAEAEDILQEAFTDAFRRLDGFRREVAFGAWLKTIVVNRCINTLKKKRLDLSSLDSLDIERLDKGENEAHDPASEAESMVNMGDVRSAIGALPEGYRVVFSLYAVEGYDHEEIGQILGISDAHGGRCGQYRRSGGTAAPADCPRSHCVSN